MTLSEKSTRDSGAGDRIARLLKTATPEETIELLCEALDWCHVYLPPREYADRKAEEFRSVISARFPQFSQSPIMSREASVAITDAARSRIDRREGSLWPTTT